MNLIKALFIVCSKFGQGQYLQSTDYIKLAVIANITFLLKCMF